MTFIEANTIEAFVRDLLCGMLVEGRDRLEPGGAVVQLVKKPPEQVTAVPNPMPPVVHEGRCEIANASCGQGVQIFT